MAFFKSKSNRNVKPRKVARNCPFCAGEDVSFKEVDVLKKYVTERGKILSHDRTGICSKHQREVARAIKYARHLGLLQFVAR